MVSIRIYPERIDLVAHDSVVASHVRCFGRNETRYDWQHYIPLIERKPGALRNGAPFADMPPPLQQLRAWLLKREGGDRLMAKILASGSPSRLGSCSDRGRTGSRIRPSEYRTYREYLAPTQVSTAASASGDAFNGDRNACRRYEPL